MDGIIKKKDKSCVNDELKRYQAEMDADTAKLKGLVESEDTFDKSIRVYTYEDGKILEKMCENPSWPNITHDGCLMYENTFSTDETRVVKWEKESMNGLAELFKRRISETGEELTKLSKDLIKTMRLLEKLNDDYPDPKEM